MITFRMIKGVKIWKGGRYMSGSYRLVRKRMFSTSQLFGYHYDKEAMTGEYHGRINLHRYAKFRRRKGVKSIKPYVSLLFSL